MTPPADFSALSSSEKNALIATLLARVEELVARVEALEAENAALRERLDLPLKTPANSSTPPSQGHKAGGGAKTKPKGKAHAGAHRPLHPHPTRRRDVFADHCPHCRAEVTGVAQAPLQAYDRIEIAEITPDVVRVTLHGGTCPCCHGRFKAAPPAGLEPGSPFGPNLRAFVLYLRFGHGTCNSYVHGLRFFFRVTLGRDDTRFQIPRSRKEQRLPQVLSRAEVRALIEAAASLGRKAQARENAR